MIGKQGDLTLSFVFDDQGSVEVRRAIRDVSAELAGTRSAADRASDGFNKLKTNVQNTQSGFTKLKGILGNISGEVRNWGVVWSAVGAFAFAAAKMVDDSLDTIRGKTGLTGGALVELQNSFKSVASTVPQHMGSVAMVMVKIQQLSGLSGKAAEEFGRTILRVSSVMGIEAVGYVEEYIKTMTKWGISMTEAPKYLDFLLKVSQATGASMEQLTGILKFSQSTLDELGLSFKQGAALIGSLEKAGVNTSMVFAMLRITLRQAAKEGEPLQEVFKKVISEIKNTSDVTRANELAFKYFGRAAMEVKAAIQAGRFEVDEFVRSLESQNETVNSAYNATRSFAEIWGEAKNKILIALEPLGKTLLKIGEEYLPRLATFVDKLMKKFDAMGEGGKKTAGIFLAVVGPLAGVLTILEKVITLFGKWGGRIKDTGSGLIALVTQVGNTNKVLVEETGQMVTVVKGKQALLNVVAALANKFQFLGIAIAGIGWVYLQKQIQKNAQVMTEVITGHKMWNQHMSKTYEESLKLEMTLKRAVGWQEFIKSAKVAGVTMDQFRDALATYGGDVVKTMDAIAAGQIKKGQVMTAVFHAISRQHEKEKIQQDEMAAKMEKVDKLMIEWEKKKQKEFIATAKILTSLGPIPGWLGILFQQLSKITTETTESFSDKLKELDITLRSKLIERLKDAQGAMKEFGKDMTKASFEKLKDEIMKMRIELGMVTATERDLYKLKERGLLTINKEKEEIKSLTSQFHTLHQQYASGGISLSQFTTALQALSEETKKVVGTDLIVALKFMLDGFFKFGESAGVVSVALNETSEQGQKFNTMLGFLNPKLIEGMKWMWDTGKAAEDLGIKVRQQLTPEIKKLTEGFFKLFMQGNMSKESLKSAVSTIVAKMKELGIVRPEKAFTESMQKMYDALRMLLPMLNLPPIKLKFDFSELKDNKEAIAAFAALSGAAGVWADTFKTQADAIRGRITDTMTLAERAALESSAVFQENMGALVGSVGLAADQISRYFMELPEGAKASAKEVLKAIGPALAGQVGGALGQMISGAKKSFASLGSALGGAIGSVIPVIGPILGSLVGGLLGGLFKRKEIKTEAQRLAEELKMMTKDIQVGMKGVGEISESIAKSIAEDIQKSKGALEGYAAVSKHFAEIIRDVGVNQENVNELWQRAGDIIQHVTSGALGAKDGMKALADSFTAMLEGAKKLGTEGSKAMVDFILKLRESGLQVPEVTQYIQEELMKIPAALNTIIKNIYAPTMPIKDMKLAIEDLKTEMAKLNPKEDADRWKELNKQLNLLNKQLTEATEKSPKTKKQLDNMASLAVLSFDAMLASGKTFLEALSAMKDPLAEMTKRYHDLGLEIPEVLKPLAGMIDLAEQFPGVFDNMSAALQILSSLRNSAYLTQGAFDSLVSVFEEYAEAILGVKGNLEDYMNTANLTQLQIEALLPVVAQFVGAASIFGLAVPEWMKTFVTKQLGVDWDKFKEIVAAQASSGIATVQKLKDLIAQNDDIKKNLMGQQEDISVRDDFRFGLLADRVGEHLSHLGDRITGAIEKIPNVPGVIPPAPGPEPPPGPGPTPTQYGFHGIVKGPRMFFVEPGITEKVDISRVGSKGPNESNVTVYIEPLLVPREHDSIIEFVIKKIERGGVRVPISAVRGI